MSVSQYRWQPMPIEKAREICDATRAAIAAHQAGGMRSPDPAVRAAVIAMPLSAETFEDRMRAHRRLEPVLDDFERARLDAYRLCIGLGMSETAARAEAARVAAPIRKQVDKLIADRKRALDACVEKNRKRRLEAERALAQKAGYR